MAQALQNLRSPFTPISGLPQVSQSLVVMAVPPRAFSHHNVDSTVTDTPYCFFCTQSNIPYCISQSNVRVSQVLHLPPRSPAQCSPHSTQLIPDRSLSNRFLAVIIDADIRSAFAKRAAFNLTHFSPSVFFVFGETAVRPSDLTIADHGRLRNFRFSISSLILIFI